MDFKFRPIGIFQALLVSIEEVKDDDERWQLGFACPGRTGSGAKAKTGSIESVADLIGGAVKAKVSKKYLHMLKSIGVNVGCRCTLYAAIDNYAIPAEGKSKAANGLWFELIEVQLGDKKVEAPLEQKVT